MDSGHKHSQRLLGCSPFFHLKLNRKKIYPHSVSIIKHYCNSPIHILFRSVIKCLFMQSIKFIEYLPLLRNDHHLKRTNDFLPIDRYTKHHILLFHPKSRPTFILSINIVLSVLTLYTKHCTPASKAYNKRKEKNRRSKKKFQISSSPEVHGSKDMHYFSSF